MEHVRVGDDHLPAARTTLRTLAGVSPSYVWLFRPMPAASASGGDELVGGQRLGGEEVERPRRLVLGDRVEDREVVAERLARGGRRDDDDVAPPAAAAYAAAWWV